MALLIGLLLAGLLALPACVSAIEDPPGCSLAHGGAGSVSQGGLNFNLAQAHVGDTVQVFPSLGMVSNACRAINVTGIVYIATGPLTNFLTNVTLNPGALISCPTDALCRPGPYSILITPAMVGAPVNTPLGGAAGRAKTVRAVETGFGTVLAGDVNEQLSDFHTASIQIVTPCIQVFKTCDLPPGQTWFPPDTQVRFRGYVTNCGDISLTNVAVTDDRVGPMQLFSPTNGQPLTGNVTLVPGAYAVFSNSFLPTPQEIQAGSATDVITVTGMDTATIGGPLSSATNSYAGVCGICVPPVTEPTIVFDSLYLTGTPDTSRSVSGYFSVAQGFRAGNFSSTLVEVSLDLTTNGPGPCIVQFFENITVGQAGGNLLATLQGPLHPDTGVAIYTPTNSITIQANKNYWVSARSPGQQFSCSWMLDENAVAPTIGTSLGIALHDDGTYNDGRWVWPGPSIMRMRVEVDIPNALTLAGFGVRTNEFGFNIIGSSNLVVVVEACTNLLNPVWQPIKTNTLTSGSSYFSDSQWTNYPGRFYRARWP